jgi:WD40 repeat protein
VEKRVRVAAALEQWAAEHNDQLSPETRDEVHKIATTISDSALHDQTIAGVGDNFGDQLGELFSQARAERATALVQVVAGWLEKRSAGQADSAEVAAPNLGETNDDHASDPDFDQGEIVEIVEIADEHLSVAAVAGHDDSVLDSDDSVFETLASDDQQPSDPNSPSPRFPLPSQPLLPEVLAEDHYIEAPAFLRSDKVDEEDDVRLYGPRRPWRAIVGTGFALSLMAGAAFAGWYWFTQSTADTDTVDAATAPVAVAEPTIVQNADSAPANPPEVPAVEPTVTADAPPEALSSWAETTPILNSGTAQILASTYSVSPANRAVLTGHTAAITGIVISDDGRVFTSGADRRLVDWGAEVTLTSPDVLNVVSPLTVLERTIDQRIIAGDAAGNIAVIDMVNTSEPIIIAVHNEAISATAELSDGRLAVASVDGDVDVFAIASPTERITLSHSNEVTAVAALADGTIATASVDGLVRIWSVDGTGEPAEINTLGSPITAMILLTDGRLATASVDGAIHVVSTQPRASDPLVLPGHVGAIRSLFEIQLPDGSLALASGGDDTTIRLWDLATQSLLRVLDGHGDIISGIDALPDGRLVSTSGDGTGRVWDLLVPASRPVIAPHDWNISAIHPWDNDQFVTGGTDGKVMLASTADTSEPLLLTRHSAPIVGVNTLQTGNVISLDASSVLRISQPSGDPSGLIEMNVAPGATSLDVRDSRGIVTGHADGSVRFHDLAEEVTSLDVHDSGVNDVVALSSGLVASAGQDMTVRIIDFDNPDQVRVFDLHTAPVDVVIELADGRIASAGSDGIYVYTVEGLAQDHLRLNGQRTRTISLVALPNNQLVSTGDDGRVRLWDLNRPESESITLVDIPGIINPHVIQANNGLFVAGAARGYVIFALT